MPQHSLLPLGPRSVGLRLTILDRHPELDPTWLFQIEHRTLDEPWKTLRADIYHGRMLDMASTWGSEMVASFLFDEGGEDLFRTGRSLAKAARKHHEADWE